MPEHKKGETKSQWMSRCIPYVIKNEKLKASHAIAKCNGMWEQHIKQEKSGQ